MPLRDLHPSDRPRERLIRDGPEGLTDADLLAIVIEVGTRSLDAGSVAESLLGRFPDLRRLAGAGIMDLQKVPGLGHAKACRLKAALALAGRLGERPYQRGQPVRDAGEVFERVGKRLIHLDHEVFVALALDTQGRIITELELSRGGACSVDFRPADVYRALLGVGATSTILVHNHPSGEPEPSPTDLRSTDRLREAGDVLGLVLLDHVIVGRAGFVSLLARKEDSGPTAE